MNESIFKAYDVRGIYGTELTDEAAYAVGRAFAQYTHTTSIVIGRDNRTSSPTLFREVARGVQDAGVDVIDIGIVSTPMLYFASTHLDVGGAIMITASHNPKEYNGLKLCSAGAVSLGLGSGLEDVRDIALRDDFEDATRQGQVRTTDIKEAYFERLIEHADVGDAKFAIVADPANAVGTLELGVFKKMRSHVTLHTIFEDLDSDLPNHEANPVNYETLSDLQNAVKAQSADIGIAYDGDADRIGIVDETGAIVPSGIVYAILIPELLAQHPGATLVYDLRLTKHVPELIEELGGTARESAVGHTKVKALMRETQAVAGAEVSGHFFYKSMFNADSSTLTVLHLLNVMAKAGKKLSELAAAHQVYHNSGEINFKVADTDAVLQKLTESYAEGSIDTLDGVKIVFDDWWFSVRSSNTEPVIRFVMEANTEALLEEKKSEVTAIISQ